MNGMLITSLLGYGSVLLIIGGIVYALHNQISDRNSPAQTLWFKYTAHLDHHIKFQLLRRSASHIALIQLVVIGIAIALTILTSEIIFMVAVLAVLVGPWFVLQKKSSDRTTKLEEQLDGWLMLMSNALKASPSIGESLKSTANLVQPPFSEEVDLMVKENQLGTPTDRAILNASERIGSPVISGALATLVIARQTGGDLPTILERSANSLREMARLEGVVRTKTAEGKGQVVVLGLMPFVMTLILSWIQPGWLDPLTEHYVGYIITAIAGVCWFAGLVWARNILDVDI